MDQLNKEVLKSLCLQYQKEPSVDTFSKILLRVDKLALYVAWGCIGKLPHLKKADLQDVYNSAIVGLYAGVKKIKPDEIPDIVIAKFIAYMKCEIKKDFPSRPELSMDWVDTEESDKGIYTNLEFECVEENIKKLIEEGIFTQIEINIMKAHFMWEIPYTQLASLYNMHIDSVRKTAQDCVIRLRHQFRIRGIEVS